MGLHLYYVPYLTQLPYLQSCTYTDFNMYFSMRYSDSSTTFSPFLIIGFFSRSSHDDVLSACCLPTCLWVASVSSACSSFFYLFKKYDVQHPVDSVKKVHHDDAWRNSKHDGVVLCRNMIKESTPTSAYIKLTIGIKCVFCGKKLRIKNNFSVLCWIRFVTIYN